MSEWRLISSAPQDGTRILGYGRIGLESGPGVGTVKWNTLYRRWEADPSEATEYGPWECELSHWMELPPAPH